MIDDGYIPEDEVYKCNSMFDDFNNERYFIVIIYVAGMLYIPNKIVASYYLLSNTNMISCLITDSKYCEFVTTDNGNTWLFRNRFV